mgnify:CR=1 FL=1
MYVMFRTLLFIGCLFFAHESEAEVFVSSQQGIFLKNFEIEIQPRELRYFRILPENENFVAGLETRINVGSPFPNISAFICDEHNLNLYKNGNEANCFGMSKGNNQFSFKANRYSPSEHYLVLDNRYALFIKKHVNVSIYAHINLPSEMVHTLKSSFEEMLTLIHYLFIAPDFDLNLASCEQENAFSATKDGDITICSELIYGSLENKGAFVSILFHELGHTFMNLWGLPHYSNEKTADEFAIAVLLMSENDGEKYIYDWIKWFENRQSAEGELIAAYNGGQHPLTVQRINNIKNILANRSDFLKRWSKVLYPHMTNEALNMVINEPYQGANVSLAQEILNNRKIAGN